MNEKEKKYGIIYKATNKKNGKVYIGQTVRKLKIRKNAHEYAARNGSDSHFHRALRKHGTDAFKWEIIDTATTKEELDEKEKYWISFYGSLNRGYNMTAGGEGSEPSAEVRKKRSEAMKRAWQDEERRNKQSKIAKELFAGKHPCATLTEKQVIAIYTSGLSQKEIAELFNVSEGIVHNIKRKRAWRSVTDKLTQFPVTEQQIIDMYLSAMDAEHLAEEYFCSVDFADKVKKGIYYSELTKYYG